MLEIRPCDFKTAKAFISVNHRHNKPPCGHKYSIACYDGDRLCGVAMVGRPVARMLDDGLTVEITRNCTDGTYNACSMLYGACVRAARALGYKKIITYTLESEPGTSLKASGWKICEINAGGGYMERSKQTERIDASDIVWGRSKVFHGKESTVGKGFVKNAEPTAILHRRNHPGQGGSGHPAIAGV